MIPKLFYFIPQHVAKFGEVLFLYDNQPTYFTNLKRKYIHAKLLHIFPSFNVLALVYCTPIMNKYAYL